MKLTKVAVLLVCLCCHAHSFSQSNPQKAWQKLLEATHKLGYSVYHAQFPLPTQYKNELPSMFTANDSTPNWYSYYDEGTEEEYHYFVMTQEWAAMRLDNLHARLGGEKKDLLILFNVLQGQQTLLKEDCTYNSSKNLFFSVFNIQKVTFGNVLPVNSCSGIVSLVSDGQNMHFEGNMWREFVLGKGGSWRRESVFTFHSTEGKLLEDYKTFVLAYEVFKKSLE